MRNCVLVAVWLGIAGCGDDLSLDSPPEPGSPQIAMSMAEDSAVTIDASATDLEGETLTYSTTPATHGTVLGHGPIYTYMPAADYDGTDAFTISVSDGTSTVFIPVRLTITAVNDAPVATDLAATTLQSQGVTVVLPATDVDGPELSYTTTAPSHGALTGTAPNLTYTPVTHFHGSDSFTFTASDGLLSSNTATVTLTVTGGCGVAAAADALGAVLCDARAPD